jgi:hypothetical protein
VGLASETCAEGCERGASPEWSMWVGSAGEAEHAANGRNVDVWGKTASAVQLPVCLIFEANHLECLANTSSSTSQDRRAV